MQHLKVQKNLLADALTKVIGSVDRKQIYPVLSHCLVKIEKGGLCLIGSDLEIQVQITRYASIDSVSEPIVFTLPAKKVYDFCRALASDEELTIQILETNRLSISSKYSNLSVSSFDPASFPEIPSPAQDDIYEITQADLRVAIDSISYGMAVADIRYYLNGMLFQFDGQELTLVATDGHRLACRTIPVKINKEKSLKTSIIVPRRAVLELIRLLDHDQSSVKLSFNAQTAVFSFKDMQFVCKLIDGKYPDYKRVLPKDLPFKIEVEKDEMKQALSQIQPFLSSKEKGFNLVFMENQIEMKAQNSLNEIIKVSIPSIGAVPGVKIGFNLSYLNDFISSQKGKTFFISLKDDSAGVIFEDDLSGFYLVMPLRL